MEKPAFKKILQISMVVDDLMGYVMRYNDEYGIGPWTILEFNEKNMKELRIEGIPSKYCIKLALCDAMNVQMELVEPVYGETTYMKALRDHGPGLHHIAVEPEGGFSKFVEGLTEKGKDHFIVGGHEAGKSGIREFEYVDLRSELGTLVELYNDTDDFQPGPPKGFYPPKK